MMNLKKPQFGLLRLLIAVTVIAVVCAFIRASPEFAFATFFIWICIEAGLWFDTVASVVKRALRASWPILRVPVWILLALAVLFVAMWMVIESLP